MSGAAQATNHYVAGDLEMAANAQASASAAPDARVDMPGRSCSAGAGVICGSGVAWFGRVGLSSVAIDRRTGEIFEATNGRFERGELGDNLLGAGKAIIAYDEWGKGDNSRAAGMATFNIASAIIGTKGAGAGLKGAGTAAQASRVGAVSRAGTAMIRSGEFLGRLPTTESLAVRAQQALPSLRLPDFGSLARVGVPHHVDVPRVDTPNVDVPRADVPTVDVPSSAVDTPNPGSVGDNLSNRTPNLDTPSTPNVDAPGPWGNDGPPVGGTVPDAPSTPDTSRTPGDSTPGDSTPGGSTTPGDGTPGDGTPGDHGAADSTPGDDTPGDTIPGDTTPDPTPGDTTPGDPNLGARPDGSWVGREHGSEFTLTPEQNAAADRFLAGARVDEGQISPQVTSVADNIDGARMQGYPDFVLKGEDSLKRKLATDLAENPDLNLDEAITGLRDSVRYTIEVPPTNYADGVVGAVDDLRARGFENVTWKPTWDVPDSYKGVNSTWRDPATGRVFELQFHTPDSFAAKMATHELYEAQRVPGVPANEVARLRAEQGEIFRQVDVPPGTDRLTALGDDLASDRQPVAVAAGHGSGHGPTGGVDDARPLNDRPGDGHGLTGGDHGSHDIQNPHGDSPADTPDASSGDRPDGGALHNGADHGDATLEDASAEHRASTDHMPAPEPGQRSLEIISESRVERGSDGLIETVDGRSIDEYLHDVAEQRGEQFRDARADGTISRDETGPMTAVALDRGTGEIVEATNGDFNSVIPSGDLHPLLRERLDVLQAKGPYPALNKDGSVDLDSDGNPATRDYPHPDNPLRHAEIKAVNELLWRRGPNVDASMFEQLRVDNHFPFGRDGVRSAPCCVNCGSLLSGTPSNAGRFTGYPPGSNNLRPE